MTRPQQGAGVGAEGCEEDGGRLDVALQTHEAHGNVYRGDIVGVALQVRRTNIIYGVLMKISTQTNTSCRWKPEFDVQENMLDKNRKF